MLFEPYGIIFDLDGTICDSEDLALGATNRVLKRFGVDREVSSTEYREGSQYPTKERLAWHFSKNIADPIGIEMSSAFDDDYIDLVTKECPAIYGGIAQLLCIVNTWPQSKLSVLTNATDRYANKVIDTHDLRDVFPIALGVGKDITRGKPHPDGLEKICALTDIPPHRCVYVGDSPTDGNAAEAAGMHSIGVTWGNHSHESLSGHFKEVVDSVQDLTAKLNTFKKKMITQGCQSQRRIVETEQYDCVGSPPASNLSDASSTVESKGSVRRRVSWEANVVDNEHMNKFRTDDEFWDPS